MNAALCRGEQWLKSPPQKPSAPYCRKLAAMTEELKSLIDAVAGAPVLVVWLAAGYLLYKLLLAGSIVAAVLKGWLAAMNVLNNRQEKLNIDDRLTSISEIADKFVISGYENELKEAIKRCAGKGIGIESNYLHKESIKWLNRAITLKEQVDSGEVYIQASERAPNG